MKCTGFEHDLALWVEGDLPPGPARRLEEHLAACGACREFVESLRDSQAAWKGSLAEIAEEDLEVVRQRVLSRIRSEEPRRRLRAWALAPVGVAAALFFAWMLVSRPAPVTPPLAPVVRPAVPVAQRPRPARMRPRATSAPLLVKLYTDDPEVIIYWIIERKGD